MKIIDGIPVWGEPLQNAVEQKWTKETVRKLFKEQAFRTDYPTYDETYQAIADAHNNIRKI